MRAPFWLTVLLATLLALGVPFPGWAGAEHPPTEAAEGSSAVPGLLSAPFLDSASTSGPDLSRAWRRYRVSRRVFNTGAVLFGLGGTAYAVGLAGDALSDTPGEAAVSGIVALVFGVPFLVIGSGLSLVGAGLGRGALSRAGIKLPWWPLAAGMVAFGVGLGSFFTWKASLVFPPAMVVSMVFAIVQVVHNGRASQAHLPKASVAVVPAPVGRAPGLVLLARF